MIQPQNAIHGAAQPGRMRIRIGHQYAPGGAGAPSAEVTWDPQELINGHLIMTGDSGSGKTHNLRSFIGQIAATAGPTLQRVHIFDTHGDINVGGSVVQFSQSTPYAYNPLDVYPDPHFGGPRRSAATFVGMIQRARKLGTTQEAVLRNILFDVYAMKGYHPDNPMTWGEEGGPGRPTDLPANRIYLDVPFEEKDLAKDIARRDGSLLTFDRDARCWWTPRYTDGLRRWPEKAWGKTPPTIHDVISLAQLKLKQLWVGVDQKSMFALENFCKATEQLQKKLKSTTQRSATEDPVLLQEEREAAAERVRDALEGFLERCTTGEEIDDLIRYESAQTLKSLLDRLENLKATGVCRSVPPPFDPEALVHRYELRALADADRAAFIDNALERMFQRAIARGEVSGVTDIVVIDEAVRYMVDDHDHIITRLIAESRKFGIALFLISQSPTQFPEEILAGVGCKVILGLDPMFHRMAASKLGLEQKFIEAIRPRELILVNRKLRSKVPQWIPVRLQ